MRHANSLPPEDCDRRIQRNETPFSPDWTPAFQPSTTSGDRYRTRSHVNRRLPQPDTDLQALMESPPFVDPEPSIVDSMGRLEVLNGAVDNLPHRHRWVFEAQHYRGLSYRQIGRELNVSKTTAHRLFQEALIMLREELS